jgi:hypothetical protein
VIFREKYLAQKSSRQPHSLFSALMALAVPNRHSRLDYLTVLLDGLPESLPNPGLDVTATYYVDLVPPFSLDQAHITRHHGNEAEAFCWVLHTIFIADGEWQIVERGESIRAVLGVLEDYLKKYPNNFRILEWINKFIIALETFYHKRGLPVHNDIILTCIFMLIPTYSARRLRFCQVLSHLGTFPRPLTAYRASFV